MYRAASILLLLLVATAAGAVRPLGWNNADWVASATAIYPCDLVKMTNEDWVAQGGASGKTEDSNGWITAISGGTASSYYRASMLIDLDHTDYPEYCDTDEEIIVGATSGTRCPANYPRGEYTLDCSGSTDAKVGVGRDADGDPTTTCGTPITFQVTNPTSNGLEIQVWKEPAFTGTPAIRVYPSGTNPMACDPDTDTFNTLYKKFLVRSQAYGMRHTGWMRSFYQGTLTNIDDWASRTPLTRRTWMSSAESPTFTGRGVPPEVTVMLSQELYEDYGHVMIPWIVFPVTTLDDWHTNFATYVANTANLNAAIPVWIEWGNEVWNTGAAYLFQFNVVLALANTAGITGSDGDKVKKYQAQRSAEVYELWKTAFGGLTRLKRVLGMQAKDCCSPSDYSVYTGYAIPGALTTIDDYIDYAAVAPYLSVADTTTADIHDKHSLRGDNSSYDVVTNAECGTDAAHITGGTTEFACCATLTCKGMKEWGDEQFCDSLIGNIESQRLQTLTHKTAVEATTNLEGNTVRLILYEGGPNHDDHGGGSDANNTGEWDEPFIATHQRSHRAACMEDVVNQYLDTMYLATGNQPLFMLNDINKHTKFQHFGWSDSLVKANGDQATCRNGTMRGGIYWANQ